MLGTPIALAVTCMVICQLSIIDLDYRDFYVVSSSIDVSNVH